MVAFLAGACLIVTCKYRNNVVSIQYSQPGNKLLTYTKTKGGGSRRSSPHFGLRCGDCRGCVFIDFTLNFGIYVGATSHTDRNEFVKTC